MKKICLILIVFIALSVSFACNQGTQTKTNQENKKEDIKSEQKKDFVSADDAAKNALKAGDKMPSFIMPNVKKEMIKSEDLLKKSNLVVVFYRGDWCPFCNMYLKRLQDNIKDIKANGGELVAISVENPDDSLSVAQKNDLEFEVLSDTNLDASRKFKIVYQLPPETDEKYKKNGIDLVKDNGTEKPELPISATYIVNQSGEITYAFLNPDYKKRLEPEDVIKELKKIKKES